jgi:hypothetical protein
MADKKEDFLKGDFKHLRNVVNIMIPGLATHGDNFGFSVEEIAENTAKMNSVVTTHDTAELSKQAAKTAVEVAQAAKTDGKANMRATAKRFKAHPKYTRAIGEEMGIIGKEIHYDPSTMKPTLKVRIVAGYPSVGFVKSYSEGVAIYSKRADEADYTLLGRDYSSPYEDKRANLVHGAPELRLYKARYIFDDKEDGLMSESVEITVNEDY